MREAGLLVVKTVLAVSFCIFLCYQLIPRQIAALFGAGTEAYFDFAARFFRIFLMMTFLNGLQSSVGGFFSAQGKPLSASSFRRAPDHIPAALAAPAGALGLDGVLWSAP
ncbi:MAG: MATE family efflux transporter [Cloacibacillus evryensis]